MEYQLSAELTTPADTADLDPLQQVGVVALLEGRLSRLAAIEGPDGVEITPVEHSVHAHLGGANVSWLLDAPALVFAEDATRSVLGQLLDETEMLHGWQVKHCAVTATDDQLESALAAEAEPETAGEPGPEAALQVAERRQRLLDAAEYLYAFDLTAFGWTGPETHADATADARSSTSTTTAAVTEEEARYAAGALIHGLEMLTDELFSDIQLLEDEDFTADEVEALWVLDELPTQFSDQYGSVFAKQLLVATAILGHRLTKPGWTPPLCVAEALALHIVKSRAEMELEMAEVASEERAAVLLAHFDEHAFTDRAHEELYDAADLDTLDVDVTSWFRPNPDVTDAPSLHPYLTDEAPPL